MLQQPAPDDFVVASGKTFSVRHFAEKVFARLEMPIEWQGAGGHEKGIEVKSGRVLIEIDPKYLRPTEVDLLLGDAAKAKRILGWEPKTDLDALIDMMVAADLRIAEKERRAEGLWVSGVTGLQA
jgi:GDPmannose 4,6-dehydratase